MIQFYPNGDRAYCKAVEERLREMVLAHRVVMTEAPHDSGDGGTSRAGDETADDESPGDRDEPVLTQSGRTYRGRAEIDAFLDELEQEVTLGRQFQSDACYLDPDDPSHCL